MTWAPPPKGQQNGEIVSYAVEYREEGSNSTVVNTTRGMRYTAEGLTTDRVYQFKVAASTMNGTGPFSEWTEVVTIPTRPYPFAYVHVRADGRKIESSNTLVTNQCCVESGSQFAQLRARLIILTCMFHYNKMISTGYIHIANNLLLT